MDILWSRWLFRYFRAQITSLMRSCSLSLSKLYLWTAILIVNLYLAWRIQGPTNLDKIKEKISPPSSPLNQSVRIRVQSKTRHVSITEKKRGERLVVQDCSYQYVCWDSQCVPNKNPQKQTLKMPLNLMQ